MEAELDMKVIIHLDVNNAFLSWQTVDLLKNECTFDYRNYCSVVAGSEEARRGMVLARSELAKKCGIKTGEALFSARKKTKKLYVLPTRHDLYRKYSDELYQFLKTYFLEIERYSIDEVFIDYTSHLLIYGDPLQFAHKLQTEIYDKLGYTVNIGIGNNKFLAKMAGELKKPNAINTIYRYEISTKLWPLPIENMFMVGKKTAIKLKLLGIDCIGDLANYPVDKLIIHFKKVKGQELKDCAQGNGSEKVNYLREMPKGISRGQTLPQDINDRSAAIVVITELASRVCRQLRTEKAYAQGVMISIKNNYFFSYRTHQKLSFSSDSTELITKKIINLFDKLWQKDAIRGITVGVFNLTKQHIRQLSIFDNVEKKYIDQVIDELNERYGPNSVKKAISQYNDQYM